MKENKTLIKETSLFKFFAGKPANASGMYHDLLPLGHNRALVVTLAMPLTCEPHPAFIFDLTNNLMTPMNQSFVHARNAVEDFFLAKKEKDLIVFDHGFDQHPFFGATPKFFQQTNQQYFLDLSTLAYPASFNFNGFAGDWDGDGKKELFICNLSRQGAKLLALDQHHQFVSADERLPDFLSREFFKALSGCAYRDSQQTLHLVLGSAGFLQQSQSDLLLINNNQGRFTNQDLLWLPERRGGRDWSVIDMQAKRGKILSNAHDKDTQQGVIDLYQEDSHLHFSHASKEALYYEKDCWFPRISFANLSSKDSGDIIAIKGRGLKNYVKKDLNIVYLKQENNTYIDCSDQFAALSDLEFIGFMVIEKFNSPSDIVFMDHSGNYYYCQRK